MRLYYCETPNPRKTCAVAKHLDVQLEYIRIDLSKGEQQEPDYLAINPNGKVPALTDGGVSIWESAAIMMYLSHHANSDLWPRSTEAQVEVLKWLAWDIAHFSRHGGTMFFENVIKENFGIGKPDPAVVESALKFFRQFAGVLNRHLDGRSYLVGNRLTIADFGVASILSFSAEARLPVNEFSEITRWNNTLMDIPAWNDPWPSA